MIELAVQLAAARAPAVSCVRTCVRRSATTGPGMGRTCTSGTASTFRPSTSWPPPRGPRDEVFVGRDNVDARPDSFRL
jgi:hypothetical protein